MTPLVQILKRLLDGGGVKAALLVDKQGQCLASQGDGASMELVAETHFNETLSLGNVCRDAHGSSVFCGSSQNIVRFESVAGGRCILTLVSDDPLAPTRLRSAIDRTKDELAEALRTLRWESV